MAEGMLIEVLNKLEELEQPWRKAVNQANDEGDNGLFSFAAGGASALHEARKKVMEMVGMQPAEKWRKPRKG